MSGRDEDEAWRAIVENYGERPRVEDPPPPPAPGPRPFDPTLADLDDLEDPEDATGPGEFVPPDPPPGPRLRLPQHLPWLGVLGSPVVLVLVLLTGLPLPGWAGYGLVAGFVGGFVWLVATMRRGGRDPWDDGARL